MSEIDMMRAELAQELNHAGVPSDYEGPLWDRDGLQRDFEVLGFAAPYVVVRHRETNVKGSLTFTHMPRVYFDFVPSAS